MKQYILHDRYKLTTKLGQNGDRLTLLARDIRSLEPVVIKILFLDQTPQMETLRLFKREGEILKTLNHPSIPRYLDYFELDEKFPRQGLALVQSYMDGRSLEECLQAGRVFNEAEVRQIAIALLEILVYLHELTPSVIHRDIKPGNILLSEREGGEINQVYLIDFGAVTELATHKESSSFLVVGTQGYMAPEQVSDQVTVVSDLYSLGVTLITILTGVPPSRLPRRNLRIQFADLAEVSEDFATWLRWLTEPGVVDRPRSAREALHSLLNFQSTPTAQEILHPRRPANSRVGLVKGAALIEVRVPPIGFKGVVWVLSAIALLWNSLLGLVILLSLRAQLDVNLPMLILMGCALLIGIAMVVFCLVVALRKVRLRIDQKQITLVYDWLGIKTAVPSPEPARNIRKLLYVRGQEGNQAKIHPQLVIQAGRKKYRLGSHFLFDWMVKWGITNNPSGFGTLSQAELDWLAAELSTWLQLPIHYAHSSQGSTLQSAGQISAGQISAGQAPPDYDFLDEGSLDKISLDEDPMEERPTGNFNRDDRI